MITVLLILLGLLCVYLVTQNLSYRYDLLSMKKQLSEINEVELTNETIRTSTHLKPTAKISTEINKLITKQQAERQYYKKQVHLQKEEWANISHDLRTPLTSLKGYMELLKTDNLTAEEKQQYITVIDKKIENLIGSINLFYDISLIESQSLTINQNYHDITELMTDVCLSHYHELQLKSLDLTLEETMPINLLIDKQMTTRVMNNILQNAIRFAEKEINIHYDCTTDSVNVTISNDISTHNVIDTERLFERSYMMDNSRQGNHNGLGLYIVRELMTQQGGQVEVTLDDQLFSITCYFKR